MASPDPTLGAKPPDVQVIPMGFGPDPSAERREGVKP